VGLIKIIGKRMKINLDSQVIELTCPHCGHKLQESIGKLKTNPTLICGKCQGRVKIDANNMRTEIAKVEESLSQMQRKLAGFGK
jgi:transcription elongation factor Elf1